jgi:hypothetical protein
VTWTAAAILGGSILAAVALVGYLVHRAGGRARDAEADLAVERSKTLDVQANALRDAHLAKTKHLSNDEIVAEADALAERIRKDMERRSNR